MAQLIKKNELIEALAISRHHHAYSSRENELLYRAENIVREQPTTTEAEIRAKAEHTYENCHNITCRRKCQKDGYNMAIDEFVEKVKPIIDEKIKGWTNSDDLRRWCERAINDVAEQLKEGEA